MANKKSSLTLWIECSSVGMFDCSIVPTLQQSNNRIIESGLDRINKSVYLGSIGESALNALTTWLNNEMQQRSGNDDSIIVLPVSASQVHEMLIIGTTSLDKDELTGDKTTLII